MKPFFAHILIMLMLMVMLSSGACTQHRLSPFETPENQSRELLSEIPRPEKPITAAVYSFPDKTGQFRQTQSGQAHYSRAVTQGATALLVNALQQAGRGEWFRVVERDRLDNVMTERRIIRDMRQAAGDSGGNPMPPPKPLLYAGVIFEGSIVGYDTNTVTGGAGSRYLGVGGSTEYRQDVVTVSLRAVSSQTGEVWKNVLVSQRVYSIKFQADAFRFVSTGDILEAEAGVTRNKPRMIALQQAIEEAVYMMVMEGITLNLWSFADADEAKEALETYRKSLDRETPPGIDEKMLQEGEP